MPNTAPSSLVVDYDLTDESQIRVIMTEMILETETGGSPITSYSMDWDEGSSGNQYVPYVGYYDDNLNLSIDFTQLTKGNYYRFRYRVKNIYGWSDYSDDVN
jgi:hypothetical protein